MTLPAILPATKGQNAPPLGIESGKRLTGPFMLDPENPERDAALGSIWPCEKREPVFDANCERLVNEIERHKLVPNHEEPAAAPRSGEAKLSVGNLLSSERLEGFCLIQIKGGRAA